MKIHCFSFFLTIVSLALFGQSNTFPTSGSVGVGTLTPNSKLHIADGLGGEQLRLSRGTGIVRFAQDPDQDNLYLFNRDATKTLMYWGSNGSIGIGTNYPGSKLHVADGLGGEQLRFSRGTGVVRFAQDPDQDNLYLFNKDASQTYMFWRSNGNVGVGTINPDYKLTVNGKIKAEEIQVVVDVADYVFDENYELKTLNEVKNFIKENKHLPNVPGRDEVKANGYQIGLMTNRLLEKIEEITLYLILMKEQNEQLIERVNKLEESSNN